MQTAIFQVITGGTPGLVNDANVLSAALDKRFEVGVNVSRERNLHLPIRRLALWCKTAVQKRIQVGIFLENIPGGWQDVFKTSVFVPNQEWLRADTLANLEKCQEIWCKTRYAEEIFQLRGYKVRYVGFTSMDRFLPNVEKDYQGFIHVQGRSSLKGTATLLDVWSRHPDWPTLTVVTSCNEFDKFACPNIGLVKSFLEDSALSYLMNSAGVHLCPSETEGFGHYLNEALSTGALVIATDAPPMNELVDPSFGVMVRFNRTSPQHLSTRFHVDASDLEQKITDVIQMSVAQKAAMGLLARRSFLEKHAAFETAIRQAAADLVQHV